MAELSSKPPVGDVRLLFLIRKLGYDIRPRVYQSQKPAFFLELKVCVEVRQIVGPIFAGSENHQEFLRKNPHGWKTPLREIGWESVRYQPFRLMTLELGL